MFEQDLAYRFSISQSTVSRIINTWINLLYLQFKQIPLCPPKAVASNMPRVFKDKYPSTRVIIDATEVYVEQPAIPELQQLTFSTYKNHNTYKGLILILASFPGSPSYRAIIPRMTFDRPVGKAEGEPGRFCHMTSVMLRHPYIRYRRGRSHTLGIDVADKKPLR